MKRLPYKKLESQVYRACKLAFGEMIDSYPDETYYAFALFTNDSLQTLHPYANTEEELDITVARYNKTIDKKYGIKSTRSGMRWSYGDWGVQDIGGEYFSPVNDTLYSMEQQIDEMDDDSRVQCMVSAWESVLNGLIKLNKDQFFGSRRKRSAITLMIVGDLPDDSINECVKCLNPPSVANRYLEWDPDA